MYGYQEAQIKKCVKKSNEGKLPLRIQILIKFNKLLNVILDTDEQRKIFFVCTLSIKKMWFLRPTLAF